MKNNDGQPLSSIAFTAVALFGAYICNTLYITLCVAGKSILRFLKLLWRSSHRFRLWAAVRLKRLGMFLLRPFKRISVSFKRTAAAIKREKSKTGGRITLRSGLVIAGRVLFGKNGVMITVFNYAAPIICIFFLFSVITYASSLNYAVKLIVNGNFLGYIESEQVFLDAKEVLQDRINYLGSDLEIEVEPSYSIEQIGYSETLTKYQIADLILQNSGVSLDYGYGFYINDTFYGALTDFTRVKDTLENLLKEYETDDDSQVVAFVDEIRYDEAGLYLSESIIDEDWLIDLLTGSKQVASYYEVQEGDSQSLIAEKVDLTQDQIEALNPGFLDDYLYEGEKIQISQEVPFLSISITRTEVYNVSVPYSTESYDDDTIYEGSSRVAREGENGVNKVTADVTYVDGVETSRDVTQIVTVTEPVSELLAIGVKPTPAGTFKEGSAAYGKFMWPVDGGYVSEWGYWDGGYYDHKGVDIAGLSYGQPVYAGASGVVTYAGWSSGLGYYVDIYCEELGVTVTYAHNSVLYVTTGQYVSQGECISGAGNTGLAYGIHVHFSVRIGDTYVNPRYYLDIPAGTATPTIYN